MRQPAKRLSDANEYRIQRGLKDASGEGKEEVRFSAVSVLWGAGCLGPLTILPLGWPIPDPASPLAAGVNGFLGVRPTECLGNLSPSLSGSVVCKAGLLKVGILGQAAFKLTWRSRRSHG